MNSFKLGWSRRSVLRAVVLASGCALQPRWGWATAPESADDRRLVNRLELWNAYARKTRNLIAHAAIERKSSLLHQPLRTSTTLVFRAPASLLLRDDDRSGSTTWIEGSTVRILSHTEGTAAKLVTSDDEPAAVWLSEVLLRLLAGDSDEGLRSHGVIRVPSGRGYRIEIVPSTGSLVRKIIRSLLIDLDPVVGAIQAIEVAEAQGDRWTLELTDHRQNLDDASIEAAFADAAALLARDGV